MFRNTRAFLGRMKLLFAILLVFTAANANLKAQESPGKENGKVSVEGIVVKDRGGEPLKKTTVQMIGEDQEVSGNYSATSDTDGHFKIENVRSGRYNIILEHTGYLAVDNRHHPSGTFAITVQSAKNVNDLVFRMQPAGVLFGRVVDEDGDPVPNVEISALHYGYSSGRRQLEAASSERTNDVGEYRIGGLVPGKYFASATPPPDFRSLGTKDESANSSKQDSAYITTYYANTTDGSQAAPIQIHPGDEAAISFSLIRVNTFRVRGTVSPGGKADRNGVVMLQAKGAGSIFSAAEVDKGGRFDLRSVAPGSYTLSFVTREGGMPATTRMPVEVGNSDLNNVRLAPAAGAQIQGRLSMEGGHGFDLSQFSVSLQSPEGNEIALGGDDAFARGVAQVRKDGTFELKNVTAGTYFLEVAGGGNKARSYFLKSVIAGGRDQTDVGLRVATGSNIAIEVVLDAQGASLQGVVVDGNDQPLPNATVITAPDAEHRKQIARYGRTSTDQQGRFLLQGLTPGKYTVLAFESVDDGAYYDPEFLKQYEGSAQEVTLVPGRVQNVALKAVPAESEQQP